MKALSSSVKESFRRLGNVFELFGYSAAKFFRSNPAAWIIGLSTVLGLLARFLLVRYVSLDLLNMIFPWMKQMSPASYGLGGTGFLTIRTMWTDQEPIYILALGILAQLPCGPIETGIAGGAGASFPLYYAYYVKAMSFVSDILMSVCIYKIVRLKTGDKTYAAIAYAVLFFLPLHFINSAMWGQIDGWVCCCLMWSFYHILKKRQGLSMLMFGLAIAIKPQGIFLAPFVVYMWMERRYKFRWLWIAPLTLLATYVPFWILGSSFMKPFEWISNGFGRYPELNYGCGNIWAFFDYYTQSDTADATNSMMSSMAWMACFAVLFTFLFIAHSQHFRLDFNAMTVIAMVMTGLTPYFMPKMHERYFYVFEAMVVVYCFVCRRRWWLIILSQLSACIAYSDFMFDSPFLEVLSGSDNILLIALLNTVILAVLLYDMFRLPRRSKIDVQAEKRLLRERAELLRAQVFKSKAPQEESDESGKLAVSREKKSLEKESD